MLLERPSLPASRGLRRRGSALRAAGTVIAVASGSVAGMPSALAAGAPTVSPLPGTPDASPKTQISILGVTPKQPESVLVTGSVTGHHAGRLRPYSRGRGASFIPLRPFAQGERVTARVRVSGHRPVISSFTVANLGPTPPVLNIPVLQPAKLDHFVSRPDLLPPKITVLRSSPAASTGDIFLTPLPSPTIHPESNNAITIHPVGPGGPMIIDRRGNLVWFDQVEPPAVATNFRPQTYAGHAVLTWWQGSVTASAFGIGEGVIADPSYRTIKTVRTGNGYPADLHEFVVTPAEDALFTVYSPVMVHLRGTPAGARSPLLDSIVQEVDIRTGLVVWEWHALGHIPIADSYATPANSADFDAFHVNAMQALPGNRLLISARDTSAVYQVDRASGRVLWTLGGKASSFRLGHGARFYFQHDATMIAPNEIALFDDEAGPPMEAPSSRGLVLTLDTRRNRASVVHEYHRPGSDTSAQSEGSVQTLPGGNVFVGFGSTPFFSEFSAGGRMLFDARLPIDDGSYRAYRFPWSATPRTRPDVAVRRSPPGQATVYASWNGATTVARWQVLAGSRATALSPVASARRTGFETSIAVSSSATTFAVRALNSRGQILATSKPVSPS